MCSRSYLLLPDFASTGFMMQGASLLATLVDCGNVDSIGGIHTMVKPDPIKSQECIWLGAVARFQFADLLERPIARFPLPYEILTSSGRERYEY